MGSFTERQPRELGAEYPPPGEQQHIDSLIHSLRAKMERDYATSRTLRDAHPKMHGCVRGEFSIAPNLPKELAIGLFSQSRTYPAWVRFSNQNNIAAADSKPDIRGVAIKLMSVHGEKLMQDYAGETTQDFILINDSRFVTKDLAEFDGLVKAFIGGIPKLLWYFVTHLRVLGNLKSSIRRFSNPFGIRYFSVAPYLLGQRAVKYSLTPRGAGS